jgi:hypothetical protein
MVEDSQLLHLAGIGCPGIMIIEDSESQEAND